MIIGVTLGLVLSSGIIFYWIINMVEGPPKGVPAELAVLSLVDNGENDYMDIKLVKEGTGHFGFGYFRSPALWIYLTHGENSILVIVAKNYVKIVAENYVNEKEVPEEFKLVNNMARARFYADVVKKGRIYHVELRQSFGALLFKGDVLCT